ncbi:alpha-D-ribose 1-methylphosphonate 5-triphosphate synthase subunit PhnH [Alteribacillus persepolensis]|uniref:Alpha-D-ribose 1-methylphosphonate 5-triphosphate synthase subunit PhnH n=1 Tax=Alteribacillus persepolensis TaxID=568899 RepID=A0A1G8GVG0_9BACI|nr:phosphonate C-P lyase system protein PhnH [Alteribacillus persepolensis]SDH98377.1 alpha-D-ribose 1-methylphosphonate 5-triphosphate synthase subunit PhnH [Alteribacillus persepolensis]
MMVDQIHDTQHVYRKLLHSMSRPGTISSVQKAASHVHKRQLCFDSTFLSALTLLDGEVTFHVLSDYSQQAFAAAIAEYTLAKFASIEQADYIFVLDDASEASLLTAVNHCKNGYLINPQFSATLIIESSPVTHDHQLLLTGPGIKNEATLQTGCSPSFWEARNVRTKEYPLGIDVIFTDETDQVVCIPRTTSVAYAEVE